MMLIIMLFGLFMLNSQHEKKSISKNYMTVSWEYKNDRVYFEMSAPTDGWLTIGFNSSTNIQGAYLLMGNVVKGDVNLVEHYTLSAGNYKPIESLGSKKQVADISGVEKAKFTRLNFSLPVKALGKYQRDLHSGLNYTLILAYSREDDFQHHSMMRTSMQITL